VLERALASANPVTAKGGDYTLRALLDDFTLDFDTSAPLEAEVEIALRQTLGKAYRNLTEYRSAERQFQRALSLARAGELRQEAARARAELGWLKHAEGSHQEAERHLAAAVEELDPAGGDRVLAEVRLAEVQRDLGKESQALATVRGALRRPFAGDLSLDIYQDAASVLLECGEVEASIVAAEKALALAEETAGAESPRTIGPLLALARSKWQTEDTASAEELGGAALRRAEKNLGSDHPLTLEVKTRLAEFSGSAAEHREVFDALTKRLGTGHPDTMEELIRLCFSTLEEGDTQPELRTDSSTRLSAISGVSMTELVDKIRKLGRIAEFKSVVQRGLREARRRSGQERLAMELECVAHYLDLADGRKDAAHDGLKPLSVRVAAVCGEKENFSIAVRLLLAMASENHPADFDAALVGLLDILRERPLDDYPALRYLDQMMRLHRKRGDPGIEKEIIEEGLRRLPRGGAHPPHFRIHALLNLASVSRRLGRESEARETMRQALSESTELGPRLEEKWHEAVRLATLSLDTKADGESKKEAE